MLSGYERSGMMKTILVMFVCLGFLASAQAMQVNSTVVKQQSSFVRNQQQRLYDFLDLKQKKIYFTKYDELKCRETMVQRPESFRFSCTLPIPSKAKTSKFREAKSSLNKTFTVLNQKKNVQISISPDARNITFATSFESTGVDFDVIQFNADLQSAVSGTAHELFKKAMRTPLVLNVLEN